MHERTHIQRERHAHTTRTHTHAPPQPRLLPSPFSQLSSRHRLCRWRWVTLCRAASQRTRASRTRSNSRRRSRHVPHHCCAQPDCTWTHIRAKRRLQCCIGRPSAHRCCARHQHLLTHRGSPCISATSTSSTTVTAELRSIAVPRAERSSRMGRRGSLRLQQGHLPSREQKPGERRLPQ